MENLIGFKEWPKISRLNRDIVITEKIDGTNAAIGIVEERVQVRPPSLDLSPDFVDLGTFETKYTVYAQSRSRIITPGKNNDNFGFAAWVEKNRDVLIQTLGPGLHFGEWWGLGIGRGYGLTERRFSLFNTAKWGEGEGAEALAYARKSGVAIYSVPVLYTGPWVNTLGFIDNTADDPKPFLTREQMAGGTWPAMQADYEAAERKIAEFMLRHDLFQGNIDGTPAGESIRSDLLALLQVNPRPRFAPNFVLEWLRGVGSFAAEGFAEPEGICVFHKASSVIFKATIEKDAEWKGKSQPSSTS